ncbi:tripartite tricarboxylate transporter substrate binding protein [Variovorax sp. OV329]|uniref:Bug family tripartite tricarboxylate transporter substrate binding protein n=1 Tax=Variovorax sp. OV329 TaxID=1882825 RepID=UPI0008E6A78E|nr:tripartite tricarboxylate transporter substrate binding protein [Variovorax sp. OV329]SFL86951.1 Tripartite-type tricarboxylate transporter, receptor component TctC [Variovorax sp. OV329]
MFKTLIPATLALAAALSPWAASAQNSYPSKPIRLIVPFAPGGSADVVGRIMAEELRAELGQPVVVENRPGAGGNIGGDAVSKAPADGYTLLLAATGPIVVNPSLYARMSYDPAVDLAPITLIARDHNLMAVNPAVPAKNVKEFIAYAKANPTKVSFGSPGNGTPAHLGGELFNQKAGTTMTHVPYKGSGPAMNDLLAGQITVMIDNMPALLPQVQSGRLRALGVASETRASGAPDIPTVAESGLPGFTVTAWKGLMAPANTPRPVIAKLHNAAVKALAKPSVKKRLVDLGAEPAGTTPEEFGTLIARETKSWAALVKSTGAKID